MESPTLTYDNKTNSNELESLSMSQSLGVATIAVIIIIIVIIITIVAGITIIIYCVAKPMSKSCKIQRTILHIP